MVGEREREAGGRGGLDPLCLEAAFAQVAFPARKRVLLLYARASPILDPVLIARLERIPDREYPDRGDVERELARAG
jgi:hypothetical protein